MFLVYKIVGGFFIASGASLMLDGTGMSKIYKKIKKVKTPEK